MAAARADWPASRAAAWFEANHGSKRASDAALAQHCRHVATKAIQESVDGAPRCGPVGTKAVKKGKEVQLLQDNEPPVDRVGNGVAPVEVGSRARATIAP
jgi:hypothetical protein